MRLEQLRLIACGPFTECAIPLHPGMNVLYGPNEAGKSSALRAVSSLLFGFSHTTTDDFVHNYQQLRVGGVLLDALGDRLECVRRKGRTSTLRDGNDDKPIDENRLRTMLGGISEEFFGTVFGIDHGRLREGGNEVIRGQGRIGELLFAAGGVTHLREKQLALEDAASSLYKPSGRNPRINTALSQLKQINDEIRDLQRSPEEWARHDAELQQLIELQQALRKQLTDAQTRQSRLERIQSSLGLLASWKKKRTELAGLSDVVSLPPNAEERYREAREKQIQAAAAKTKAEERITALRSQLQGVSVPMELLNHASSIDQLYKRLGSHEKAVADSAVLAGQQRTSRDNAKRSVEKLGWELTLDQAAERRLSDEKKARVRVLANHYGEVTQSCVLQTQAVERLRRQLEECRTQIDGLPLLEFSPSLKELLASAAVPLESHRRLDEQRRNVQRLQQAASDTLARLPHFSGTLDQACQLKVPSEETIDRFDESSRELAGVRKLLNEQRGNLSSETSRFREELETLELAESVPTEEDLVAARELRDRGVRLAVQTLGGGEVDQNSVKSFVTEVPEGSELHLALEPTIRQADSVADRLRRESTRVAKKSSLVAQLHSLQTKTDVVDKDIAENESKQTSWAAEWKDAWKETQIAPSTPSEMRAWLRKHQELIGLASELVAAKASLSADVDTVDALQSRLSAELLSCSIEAPKDAGLELLLQLAREHADNADAAQRTHQQLKTERARLEQELTEAEHELKVANDALSQWREDWTAALLPLQLDANALPEQAEAVLTNLDELFRNLDESEKYRTRMWGIDQTAKEFGESASALCAVIASDLVGQPIEQLVTTLNQRLATAKEIQQLANSLEDRLSTEQQTFDEAESDLDASNAVLNVLLQDAACNSLADLPTAIEKSAAKKNLQTSLDDLESQLLPFCAGKSLDEFAADAESEDADRLPADIEELSGEISSLNDQRDDAIKGVERLKGVLNQFAGAAAAAEKADERQFLLSQLEVDAREYAVATVASRLLQRAVERYREKAQGPVLSKASMYFAKLTCDAFSGLRTDYDEAGHEVLVGVRKSGPTLRVESMSEGTRDQLYFALRLGTLDHWFERHEPIPFVVDDVLLTFDDVRAKAAIEVLLELSTRTQILFFTHHEHLTELIRQVAVAQEARTPVNIVSEWNGVASA
jgi:uncharacterized protein YhaN